MFDASTPTTSSHYRPILPHEASPVAVGVAIRIVPAGVVTMRDGQGKLWRAVRAGLQFSPVAGEGAKTCGLTVDLANWPAEIEKLLRGSDSSALEIVAPAPIHVHLSRVDDNLLGPRAAPDYSASKILSAHRALFYDHRTASTEPLSFPVWREQRRRDVGRIASLWQQLIAPGERLDWESLACSLARQGGKDAVKNRYQWDKDNENALDIAGIGRGEAAMLLSLERGLGLATRLKRAAEGGCGHRDDECNPVAAKPAAPPVKETRSADEQAADDVKKQQERLNAMRKSQREVTRKIAAAEAKRSGIADRCDLAKAYVELLKCNDQLQSADECLRMFAAADATVIAASIANAKTRNDLSSADRNRLLSADLDGSRAGEASKADKEAAFQKEKAKLTSADQALLDRLRAIQSQPSLARLFNLTVDILIPLDQLLAPGEQWHAFVERPGAGSAYARFGFLSAALPQLKATRRVWTTAKFRLDKPAEADVWACSRAEIDLFTALPDKLEERDRLIAQGALPQVDGVVDLGVGSAAVGGKNPRFDLVTLDVVGATENRSTAGDGQEVLTLRTAGLALIDRWRQSAAIAQAVRSRVRENCPCDQIVIDAEDLTVGYRLDVAVRPSGKGNFRWRSLCSRSIRFGDEDSCDGGVVRWTEFEALLRRVIPAATDRAAYDGALLLMPTRVSARDGNAADDKGMTADVEDIVGQWQGPPIGVDPESGAIALSKPSALRLSQLYSLSHEPGKPIKAEWRIPPLCFSHGYSVGLVPTLAGGIARRLDETGSIYRQAGEERVVLPPKGAGPRRFLRHERIAAPLVTTPRLVLERSFDELHDGLRESSRLAVFRSEPGTTSGSFKPKDVLDQTRYSPRSRTHRIIVPPSVSAVFADRHGVFGDAVKLESYAGANGGRGWKGPAGGLKDVDYDRSWTGGFPVWERATTSKGALSNDGRPANGDAVFTPRAAAAAGGRPTPYYPDPAAGYLVIAARDMAGRLLPGKPLVVPLRPGKLAFPDVRPVVLDFCTSDAVGTAPEQTRILGLDMGGGEKGYLRGDAILSAKDLPTTVWLDNAAIHAAPRAGRVAATRVEVALAPGESVEIDLWCVPTRADLVRWFDVVESATLVVALDTNGRACTDTAAFAERLKEFAPKAFETKAFDVKSGGLLAKLRGTSSTAKATICCEGQQRLPIDALALMGERIHALACKRVTPEIAARTTIQAVHAILTPAMAPVIIMDTDLPTPKPTLRLERRALAREVAAVKTARAKANAAPGAPAAPAEAPSSGPSGPDGVFVVGSVAVDRRTTGFIEVAGSGIGLISGRFDDERRRRSADEVARGLWPRNLISNEKVDSRDIYGFRVAPDGKASFEEESATLLRIDEDIPDSLETSAPRDLLQLQIESGAADPGQPNVARAGNPFRITDTRARVVTLQVSAGSRTGWCFRDAKGDVIGRSRPPDVEAAAGDSNSAVVVSQEVRVALEAQKEPSRVEPLTILPAFALTPTESDKAGSSFVVKRIVKLRLRMRRPWFSSGAGERLGIVLWPPDIHACAIAASGRAVSRDYDVASYGEKPDIDLGGWSDLDLGPGGAYVSRWGADPTKGGIRSLEWIMPPSAFADLQGAAYHMADPPDGVKAFDILARDEDEIVYVPRASMPLPVDRTDALETKKAPPDRLMIALLTYRPRFDIDSETWFVDVAIKPGATPDPFVRLGLVRYQPNAPAELRVSQPVVEWAQILNARTVTVSIDKNAPKRVSVAVSGAGKRFAARGDRGHDATRIDHWMRRPLMKISVLRRRDDGIEEVARLGPGPDGASRAFGPLAERVWIPRDKADLDRRLELCPDGVRPEGLLCHAAISPTVTADNGDLTWTTAFDLDENPLSSNTGVVYSVFVEEVEASRPATYPSEPFVAGVAPPIENEVLVVSGPRFAARVMLAPESGKNSPPAAGGR